MARTSIPSPIPLFPALEARLLAVEAALPVVRAKASRHAVHTLRSSFRALEAVLDLLRQVPGLPDGRKESDELLRTMRGLRRTAGRVRDLDVFARMLKEDAGELATGTDAEDGHPRRTREDLEDLRRFCQRSRRKLAERLVRRLERRETELATALEAVRDLYRVCPEAAMAPHALLEAIERRLHSLRELRLEQPSDQDRHRIRKAAKIARLQAEIAPDHPLLKAAGERFHAIQEAGGQWHDWLGLGHLAVDRLGKHRRSTRAIADRRDAALRAFEKVVRECLRVPVPR